jgi:hypothetical protein
MRPWTTRIARNLARPISVATWLTYQWSRSPQEDLLLVTVPSSGTHWLRILLEGALLEAYALDGDIASIRNEHMLPTFLKKDSRFKYNDQREIVRIQHTHSGYFWPMRRKKTLLLVRDLRDIMVSHFRMMERQGRFSGSFADFLRGEGVDRSRHHTLRSRIDLINGWRKASPKLSGLMIVRYEDLKHDTPAALRDVLDYAGIPALDVAQMEKVVQQGSFDNMRRLEADNPLPQYTKAKKVSVGKSGGYRDYFSEDDAAWFRHQVEAHMGDTLGYDYGRW